MRAGGRAGKLFHAGLCLLIAVGLCSSRLQAQLTNLPVIVADFNHDGIPDLLIQPALTAPNSEMTPPNATIAFGSVRTEPSAATTKA